MSILRPPLFLLVISCAVIYPYADGRFAQEPSVVWRARTSAVELPWPGLTEAVQAGCEVIREEFPTWRQGTNFTVDIWGPNDFMSFSTCVDLVDTKLSGCTGYQSGSGWVVGARQILAGRTGPRSYPSFYGALLEACDDTVDGGCAILYELADRYVPLRLGQSGAILAGDSAHTDPTNVARRTKMIARYQKLRGR